MMELSDIPKPYKRFYDDKRRRRRLYVSITTWRGTSPGAKHWYAKVYEGDNPILYSGKEYSFSEDTECLGRVFGGFMETSFSTFDAALDWVIEIIREHFLHHTVRDISGGCITPRQFKQALSEAMI